MSGRLVCRSCRNPDQALVVAMAECSLKDRLLRVGSHHGFCTCPPETVTKCPGCGVELFGAREGQVCLGCACTQPHLLGDVSMRRLATA